AGPHALRGAARHGDGWIPMGLPPEDLRAPVAELRALFAAAGKPAPEVVAYTRLPVDDAGRAGDVVAAYAAAGATRVIHGVRYTTVDEYRQQVEGLARVRR